MDIQYLVNTSEIWNSEQQLYLDGHSTDEHMNKVMVYLRSVIPENGLVQIHAPTPNSSFECVKDYEKKMNRMLKCETLRDFVKHGTFFHQDNSYDYRQDINILPSFFNYDFWFSLKLRNYEYRSNYNGLEPGLKLIPKFLSFQLKNCFENKIDQFQHFLKLNSIQHQHLLSNAINSMINYWLDLRTSNSKDINESEVYDTAKNIHSFTLIFEYRFYLLTKKGEDSLYKSLKILKDKESGFIPSHITLKQFLNIFTESPSSYIDKIQWKGSNKELKYFINELVKIGFIEGANKWIITSNCFTDKHNRALKPSQLKNNGEKVSLKVKAKLDFAINTLLNKTLPTQLL